MIPTYYVWFCVSVFLSTVGALCYFPDGDVVNDTPCNPGSANSTCCGPGYACLSNHICAVTEHTSKDIVLSSPPYVRASCTDQSWTSPECPLFCKNAANGDNVGGGGMGVGICDGTGQVNRYYCKNTMTAALGSESVICTNASSYFEFPGFPSTLTIIGYTPTSLPSAGSSGSRGSTASSQSTNAADQSPSSEETNYRKKLGLGLGLGFGLGIPLALLAGLLLYRRFHRNDQRPNMPPSPSLTARSDEEHLHLRDLASTYPADRKPPMIYEARVESRVYEVESHTPQELAAPDSPAVKKYQDYQKM